MCVYIYIYIYMTRHLTAMAPGPSSLTTQLIFKADSPMRRLGFIPESASLTSTKTWLSRQQSSSLRKIHKIFTQAFLFRLETTPVEVPEAPREGAGEDEGQPAVEREAADVPETPIAPDQAMRECLSRGH